LEKEEVFYVSVGICVVLDAIAGTNLAWAFYWSMALALLGIVSKQYFDKNAYAVASGVELAGFVAIILVVTVWYSFVLHSADATSFISPFIANFLVGAIASNFGFMIVEALTGALSRWN
jgi:hypothetical protein